MYLSKIDTRPLSFFIDMEQERDELYSSFTQLDEKKEIASFWLKFAESCAKNLSVINIMASLAYERIHEVYVDVSHGNDNVLPLYSLLYGDFGKQLLTLTNFQLRLAILTYVYSQVRNKGVFDITPEDSNYEYYVQAKETIDTVLYRIIEHELPQHEGEISDEEEGHSYVPTVGDLLEIISPLLKLEQIKRLIPIYTNLLETSKLENTIKIGNYDRLQGITLLTHIVDIAREAANRFWWDDPISELSIVSHAAEHFEFALERWKDTEGRTTTLTQQIEYVFLPMAKAEQYYSLSKHYRLLSKYALEQGDLTYSNKYLSRAAKHIKKAKAELEVNPDEFIDVIEKYSQAEKELRVFKNLTQLAKQYNSIVEDLYNNKNEELVAKCMKVEKLLSYIQASGTMPYIYGISVAYASTSTLISDLLSQDTDNLTIIHRLTAQFNFPLNAMKTAVKSINLSELMVDPENPAETMDILTELDDRLWFLERAIELLPGFMSERDNLRNEIHAIRNYVKSLIVENQIYLVADNNIVLDLILRARAHYLAKKANKHAIKTKNHSLKELIQQRLTKTKVLAVITESNLLLLALQSSYDKELRALAVKTVELIETLPEFSEGLAQAVEKQFEVKTDMHNLLELIQMDTQELNVIKTDVELKGQEINWDFLKRRENFITQIQKLTKVLKHALVGELYAKVGSEIAASHFSQAGDSLFELSNEIVKVADLLEESQKELPNTLYVLSLSMRERGRAVRDRREIKEKLPYEEIIAIMDGLILNL